MVKAGRENQINKDQTETNDEPETQVGDRLLEEKGFWELLERSKAMAGNHYENQIGLLGVFFKKLATDDLGAFYSRYENEKYRANTHLLIGAYMLVSKAIPFQDFDHFTDWLVAQGQTDFENYRQNPDLISNAPMEGIATVSIYAVLNETYTNVTGKPSPAYRQMPLQTLVTR